MKLCKTCKWWQVPKKRCYPYTDPPKPNYGDPLIYPLDEDTFEPKEMPFEVRQCFSPKLLFCERPITETHATVADGSEYIARLVTGCDFGCVNHEKSN